jgi:hypothetical protein
MTRRILFPLLLIAALSSLVMASSQESEVADNTVRIKIGNSYGSGAYLGNRLVLSCAHLFRGEQVRTGDVWFSNGDHFVAQTSGIDAEWDQALLELTEDPKKCGLSIAETNPVPGESVFMYGYGKGNSVVVVSGSVNKYVGNGSGPTDWFETVGAVEEGSSGGPITNVKGEVIGNLWGTDGTNTVGLVTGRTHKFLLPWQTRLRKAGTPCKDGQCTPQTPPSVLVPLPRRPIRGPATSAPPIIIVEPNNDLPLPEVENIKPQCDYQKIVDLLKQDDEFLSKVKGKDGKDGVDGQAGLPGADGKDAEVTTDQVSAMTAAIIQYLKADKDFIAATTGPAGKDGKDGVAGTTPDIPPTTNGWSHMVLIAPKNADYWTRLSGEYDKATSYYSMLRHIEPPTDRNIGPMPVLVAYNGGKPAKSWTGLRDVSQALTNIVRGDYDEFILTTNDK